MRSSGLHALLGVPNFSSVCGSSQILFYNCGDCHQQFLKHMINEQKDQGPELRQGCSSSQLCKISYLRCSKCSREDGKREMKIIFLVSNFISTRREQRDFCTVQHSCFRGSPSKKDYSLVTTLRYPPVIFSKLSNLEGRHIPFNLVILFMDQKQALRDNNCPGYNKKYMGIIFL